MLKREKMDAVIQQIEWMIETQLRQTKRTKIPGRLTLITDATLELTKV